MEKQKRLCEIFVATFVLAVSSYLLQVAYTARIRTNVTGLNAMAFPKAMLYILIVLCLYVVVNGLIKYGIEKKKQQKEQGEGITQREAFFGKEVVLSVVLIALYAIGWPFIGFILSSFIFMFAESRLLDAEKPWWHALIVACGYTLLVYFTFNLGFGVSFPEPLLGTLGL